MANIQQWITVGDVNIQVSFPDGVKGASITGSGKPEVAYSINYNDGEKWFWVNQQPGGALNSDSGVGPQAQLTEGKGKPQHKQRPGKG